MKARIKLKTELTSVQEESQGNDTLEYSFKRRLRLRFITSGISEIC